MRVAEFEDLRARVETPCAMDFCPGAAVLLVAGVHAPSATGAPPSSATSQKVKQSTAQSNSWCACIRDIKLDFMRLKQEKATFFSAHLHLPGGQQQESRLELGLEQERSQGRSKSDLLTHNRRCLHQYAVTWLSQKLLGGASTGAELLATRCRYNPPP